MATCRRAVRWALPIVFLAAVSFDGVSTAVPLPAPAPLPLRGLAPMGAPAAQPAGQAPARPVIQQCQTVFEILANMTELSFFTRALLDTGVYANLNTTDPDAIIFAPIDRAFQELLYTSNATAMELLGDPSLLPILLNHIAITSVDLRSVGNGGAVQTVAGANLTMWSVSVHHPAGAPPTAAFGRQVQSGRALADLIGYLPACNATIQVINEVLVPVILNATNTGNTYTFMLGESLDQPKPNVEFVMTLPGNATSGGPVDSSQSGITASGIVYNVFAT